MASRHFAAQSHALQARTVRLKLFPPPRSFNDQREVLRVLERFGEVTIFKTLKYRTIAPADQSFLATFATERAAREVAESTPIKYHLQANEVVAGSEMHGEAADASSASAQLSESQPTSSRPQEFELHVHPSTLSHEKYITSPHSNPLYGPYKPAPVKRSYVANMLSNASSSGMWSPGLRDWETDFDRWTKSTGHGYDMKDVSGEDEGLRSRISGKVGEMKIGLGNGDKEFQKGMTERAVYVRGVNRRRKEIPQVMWGVKRFVEAHRQDASKRWEV